MPVHRVPYQFYLYGDDWRDPMLPAVAPVKVKNYSVIDRLLVRFDLDQTEDRGSVAYLRAPLDNPKETT